MKASKPSMVLHHERADMLYIDFANHYGTTVLPARAYKPKDKALVEKHLFMGTRGAY